MTKLGSLCLLRNLTDTRLNGQMLGLGVKIPASRSSQWSGPAIGSSFEMLSVSTQKETSWEK